MLQKLPKSTEHAEVEIRKWITIEKVNNFVAQKKAFLKKERKLRILSRIQERLELFEKNEVDRLIGIHANEIEEYYGSLNPGDEMLFTGLEVKEGTRRQVRLMGKAYGRRINPVTIFSEAHTNSLALSIYFPQRVDRNKTWKVIILDDPVQSMDLGHVQSLVEILAEKSKDKQIIVLTHAKDFAERFRYRFASAAVKYYEFVDGKEEGPKVFLRQGGTVDYLEFVKDHKDGVEVDRKAAGNSLRSAIESVIGEILIKSGKSINKVRKLSQRTSELFEALEDEVRKGRFEHDDICKLRALLAPTTSASHAWDTRDITPGGLERGVFSVLDIRSKYFGKIST